MDVQHASALFTARTRRLLLGCLWINQGRGGILASPAPAGCGLTNPRARGPREPRFLLHPATWEGDIKSGLLWITIQDVQEEKPGLSAGWGRRYHNKRTCVLPRVRCLPLALRSPPCGTRPLSHVSAIGRERRWGRHLLEEGADTFKGTAWVSDQTTRFKNRKH